MKEQEAKQDAVDYGLFTSTAGKEYLKQLELKMRCPIWNTFSEIRQLASKISGLMDDLQCTIEGMIEEGEFTQTIPSNFDETYFKFNQLCDQLYRESDDICEAKYPIK